MGAWDAGSFQNDWALDWVADLCERGDAASVRTALSLTLEHRHVPQPSLIGRILGRRPVEHCLEAREASQALAAAEIVAFWLGNPASQYPDELAEWSRRRCDSLSPEVVALAQQAVSVIKTKSELKDLWDEGDGIVAAKWYVVIADLERRLHCRNE